MTTLAIFAIGFLMGIALGLLILQLVLIKLTADLKKIKDNIDKEYDK